MNYLRILILGLIITLLITPLLANALFIPRIKSRSIRLLIKYDPRILNIRNLELAGARIVYKASAAPILIIELSELLAYKLNNIPGIVHVSLDAKVHIMSDTAPWGVSYVGAPDTWSITKGQVDVNGDGKGEIEVAVIDTGVDYDHPDLDGNIAWCIATLNGEITSNCYDGNGHGTHVIGTIAAELDGAG